ncbi:threonine synthase [Thiomicrospira microaerophila]|uniref:threonine synthase n=1 Tax=Thiomicrospira microaerophila TaxID=406020 RepID=UPI00200EECBE|nr:threonine synthase [Thiomicrospira microaerophila]UQB41301.1 threonine synthase [Thiomicrospira microaerophila]
MNFIETRGNDGQFPLEVTFSEAILNPMSSFGGLYSPKYLPQLGADFLANHINSDYKTLAKAILNKFEVDIDEAVINQALSLYDAFDDSNNPVPVVKVYEDLYVSELFHGPTRAFKDMALQPFGTVLSAVAQARNEQFLILAATSGDTGPAALDTFRNKPNVQVVCMYPDGGTSDVQRLQMVTEDGKNLKVIGIKGDFDDAQSALKRLLTSPVFRETLSKKGIQVSAANSVNFGRIIFQTLYHVHSYLELVRQDAIKLGDKVYLNVPSGNFGNALGGYYALKMGLPVEQILIASNNNNVLTRFINEGVYDLRDSQVIPTSSPAMDILKSSNIERILFDLFGAERTKQLMLALDQDKYYRLTKEELSQVQAIFAADFCSDEEGQAYIKQAYDVGYLMDPHTATCFKVYETSRKNPTLKTIVYSTAEWTKFSPIIAKTLFGGELTADVNALKRIAEQGKVVIPPQIASLLTKPQLQDKVIAKEQIEEEIVRSL